MSWGSGYKFWKKWVQKVARIIKAQGVLSFSFTWRLIFLKTQDSWASSFHGRFQCSIYPNACEKYSRKAIQVVDLKLPALASDMSEAPPMFSAASFRVLCAQHPSALPRAFLSSLPPSSPLPSSFPSYSFKAEMQPSQRTSGHDSWVFRGSCGPALSVEVHV